MISIRAIETERGSATRSSFAWNLSFWSSCTFDNIYALRLTEPRSVGERFELAW